MRVPMLAAALAAATLSTGLAATATAAPAAPAPHQGVSITQDDGVISLDCVGHVKYLKCIVAGGRTWHLDRNASTVRDIVNADHDLTMQFSDDNARLNLCNYFETDFSTDYNLRSLQFGSLWGSQRYCTRADERAEQALVRALDQSYTKATVRLGHLSINTSEGTLVFRIR